MVDSIIRLTEEIEKLIYSPRNQRIAQAWQPEEYATGDYWKGTPVSSREIKVIPFTVKPEISMWSQILKFDMGEFHNSPRCYLENTLRMMVYRFTNFKDFTAIEKTIPIFLGVTLESSLLGSRTVFMKGQTPWLDREPIIRDYQDLSKLIFPDFHRSGLMPLVHRMYDEINELLSTAGYTVVFPEWRRGPFGVAIHIRGLENLLTDMIDNPAFVHRLMRFITDARKDWTLKRATFLGRQVNKGTLSNDEVSGAIISPRQYEEFVFPYEVELCEFHKGIAYWHSCGDTTRLLELIAEIPQIDMFHTGPWTDLKEVRRVFGEKSALQICLMSTEDVQLASERKMEQTLRNITSILKGTRYTVRADSLQVLSSLDKDIERIKTWVKIARRELTVSLT